MREVWPQHCHLHPCWQAKAQPATDNWEISKSVNPSWLSFTMLQLRAFSPFPSVWSSSACQKDKDELHRIVRTASKIISSDLKLTATVHSLWLDHKVKAIVQEAWHPASDLFQPFPSGCRYRAMRARTSRFRSSFYPQTIQSSCELICI